MDGINPQRLEHLDLTVRARRAKLDHDGGAHAREDEHRGDERPEFPHDDRDHHRQAHHPLDRPQFAALIQAIERVRQRLRARQTILGVRLEQLVDDARQRLRHRRHQRLDRRRRLLETAAQLGDRLAAAIAVRRFPVMEDEKDVTLGANTLTIANGHTIDALRFVAGDFKRLSCRITTQVPQWYETDTKRYVDVTSPDNVLVHGQLASGAEFAPANSTKPG